MNIVINNKLEKEARDYALLSRAHTSNRHDFHEGGLSAKQKKMYEGKLGEKAIKQLLLDNKVRFKEDESSHEDADMYDFIVYGKNRKELRVDVKTRTKDFHTRTLEMVEQMRNKPKDIYISVRLHQTQPHTVEIIGYALKNDFLNIDRIENQGYLDNFVLLDNELKDINIILGELEKI